MRRTPALGNMISAQLRAHALHELKVPPATRLEPLQGDLLGHWSIRINQQYRLIFQWDDDAKEAYDVYFDDYHH